MVRGNREYTQFCEKLGTENAFHLSSITIIYKFFAIEVFLISFHIYDLHIFYKLRYVEFSSTFIYAFCQLNWFELGSTLQECAF